MSHSRRLTILSVSLFALACRGAETRYALVRHGGRVMDPATGLDSIRDVGIQDGRIVAISAEPLAGAEVIDVAGKVVAPRFIDLNAHGQTSSDMQIQVRDGVTGVARRAWIWPTTCTPCAHSHAGSDRDAFAEAASLITSGGASDTHHHPHSETFRADRKLASTIRWVEADHAQIN